MRPLYEMLAEKLSCDTDKGHCTHWQTDGQACHLCGRVFGPDSDMHEMFCLPVSWNGKKYVWDWKKEDRDRRSEL